jgi:hypothetical protein
MTGTTPVVVTHDTASLTGAHRRERLLIAVAWSLLALIPLLVMGWFIGRYGPVSDDWDMLRMALNGDFFAADRTRALAFASHAITAFVAGGDVRLMQLQVVLLHGVEAILMFEVLRRIFRHWIGTHQAGYLAFVSAAIFALYPSDVSRYTMMMIHGRYLNIGILLMALCWIASGERGRIWPVIPALGLLALNLLTKEHALIFYGLLPLIPLYYGWRLRSRRWWVLAGLWYAALAAYSVWRFVIAGTQSGTRGIVIPSVGTLIRDTAESVYNVLVGIFPTTLAEHRAAVEANPLAVLVGVIAMIAAAKFMLLVYVLARRPLDMPNLPPAGRADIVRGLALAAFAVLTLLAGTLPFMVWDTDLGALSLERQLSRHTQVPAMGAALLWVIVPVLAVQVAGRRWPALRAPLVTGLIVALVGTLLLMTAAVRQFHVGEDHVVSWGLQRQFWARILELPLDSETTQLVYVRDFPKNYQNALLTSNSYNYRAALYLLTGQDVHFDMFRDEEPVDFADGQFTAPIESHVFPELVLVSYPQAVTRVLVYDATNGMVRFGPSLPAIGIGEAALYTGVNRPETVHPLTPFGQRLLGDLPPAAVCRETLRVTSTDSAPAAGDTLLRDGDTVIDRRPVATGEALDYHVRVDCGVTLTLSYATDAGIRDLPFVSGTSDLTARFATP